MNWSKTKFMMNIETETKVKIQNEEVNFVTNIGSWAIARWDNDIKHYLSREMHATNQNWQQMVNKQKNKWKYLEKAYLYYREINGWRRWRRQIHARTLHLNLFNFIWRTNFIMVLEFLLKKKSNKLRVVNSTCCIVTMQKLSFFWINMWLIFTIFQTVHFTFTRFSAMEMSTTENSSTFIRRKMSIFIWVDD